MGNKRFETSQGKEEEGAQEAEMEGELDKLLKEYGVVEVNQKKKSLMSFKYPLHYAVEKSDTEAVCLLFHFQADTKAATKARRGINPFTKDPREIKPKPACKGVRVLAMKSFRRLSIEHLCRLL